MQNKIRWGILGCGNIARKFASDLRLVDKAQLMAVGSRSIEKANAFAKDFGAVNAYGSYEELAADENIDVIYVATPHSHHYDNVLLCLNRNKAILCEKAFAVNSRQAHEMIRLARDKKIFLMEALWTKFLPHYQKLQEILKEETLGEITAVLTNFGFRPEEPVPARIFDRALAGGTLLDIGIYNIFMTISVLGKPDRIEAHMTPASTGVDAQCSILFMYKNGVMAQMFSTFLSHVAMEANICGTKGRIKLAHRFYAPDTTIEHYTGKPDTLKVIPVERDNEGFGYQYEARHVCECLEKGLTESPVMTHADTILLMEIMDEVRTKAGITYDADHII